MAGPSMAARKAAQAKGAAMPPSKPGGAPRFPIRNASDLGKAIEAVGRVRPATDAARAKVRRYIIGRAKALGLSKQIPSSWNPDGSLGSDADGDDD
jgi:hypothetical protein